MDTIDHKLLGSALESRLPENMGKWKNRLFVLGNIEPDKNPLTYIKGSIHHKRFHGHNYKNASRLMKKYTISLFGKDKLNYLDAYKLGKLMHYVADAFTFPHNEEFEGSVVEHVQYEHKLHKKIRMKMGTITTRPWSCSECVGNGNDLFQWFEQLHINYIRFRQGIEDDMEFILGVTRMYVERLLRTTPEGIIAKAS